MAGAATAAGALAPSPVDVVVAAETTGAPKLGKLPPDVLAGVVVGILKPEKAGGAAVLVPKLKPEAVAGVADEVAVNGAGAAAGAALAFGNVKPVGAAVGAGALVAPCGAAAGIAVPPKLNAGIAPPVEAGGLKLSDD